jgi:hypothetical protein
VLAVYYATMVATNTAADKLNAISAIIVIEDPIVHSLWLSHKIA